MTDNRPTNLQADYRARFVVLFHQFPPAHPRDDHWDLMLEWNGELITWSLSEKPAIGNPIPANSLPNHRMMYLDYQGQLSDDRGSVTRVMEGNYSWVPDGENRTSAVLEFDTTRWKVEFKESGVAHVAIFEQLDRAQ